MHTGRTSRRSRAKLAPRELLVLSEMVNRLPMPAVIFDESLLCLGSNAAFTNLTGFTGKDLLGKSLPRAQGRSPLTPVVASKLVDRIMNRVGTSLNLVLHGKLGGRIKVSTSIHGFYLPKPVIVLLVNAASVEAGAPSLDTNAVPVILSGREQEILLGIMEGYSSAEIGAKLFLSPKTIDTYRSRLMAKLNVSNVVQLLRLAVRSGWIKV